jgi:hypothetical protein
MAFRTRGIEPPFPRFPARNMCTLSRRAWNHPKSTTDESDQSFPFRSPLFLNFPIAVFEHQPDAIYNPLKSHEPDRIHSI